MAWRLHNLAPEAFRMRRTRRLVMLMAVIPMALALVSSTAEAQRRHGGVRSGRPGGGVVVSADSDFSAILAVQEANRPSFILFRNPNLMGAHDYFKILLPALPVLEPELMSGCVAVFRYDRLRVRKLPFSE